MEGFKDVSNLLCVWVEPVYTEEQRLAIRTYDGRVIFLGYLHPFEGLHECSFSSMYKHVNLLPFFLMVSITTGLAAVPVVGGWQRFQL